MYGGFTLALFWSFLLVRFVFNNKRCAYIYISKYVFKILLVKEICTLISDGTGRNMLTFRKKMGVVHRDREVFVHTYIYVAKHSFFLIRTGNI